MQPADRRAATAAYKERKVRAGIYAVRCAATGQVWVGEAPNLDGIANRVWFTLRHGGHRNAAMQAAWAAHGAEGLTLEVVETLPEAESAYLLGRSLSERRIHWQAHLGAERA